jgi:hypothetical protein
MLFWFNFRIMSPNYLRKLNGSCLAIVLIYMLYGNFYFCFGKILTNSYLVEFKNEVEPSMASEVARKHGFLNAGPVRIIIRFEYIRMGFFKCLFITRFSPLKNTITLFTKKVHI